MATKFISLKNTLLFCQVLTLFLFTVYLSHFFEVSLDGDRPDEDTINDFYGDEQKLWTFSKLCSNELMLNSYKFMARNKRTDYIHICGLALLHSDIRYLLRDRGNRVRVCALSLRIHHLDSCLSFRSPGLRPNDSERSADFHRNSNHLSVFGFSIVDQKRGHFRVR